jgi:hypothetical protein
MARIAWLVVTAVLLAAAQSFAQGDAAANYPNRAVKIIASSPAGGGLDIATRVIADRLAKMWGQPFVVENRQGASGNLGAEAVAQAEPDGYTLLAAQPAPLTTNIVLYKKLNFDPAAFEPLAIMISIPNTLVVRLDFPASSVADLIAYAKANPGKVNFGSQGVGTTPHLTGELFARVTGTKLVHVPYRGTAQAVNDLIAGQIDMLFLPTRLGARAISRKQNQDAGGDDTEATRFRAGGTDDGGSGGQGLSLGHLACACGAAEDTGCDHRQAQWRHQRGACGARDGGAPAGHEHDAGRRHARGGEGLHQAGGGALGRGDPRRKDQRGLGRVHSRNVRSHCSDQ